MSMNERARFNMWGYPEVGSDYDTDGEELHLPKAGVSSGGGGGSPVKRSSIDGGAGKGAGEEDDKHHFKVVASDAMSEVNGPTESRGPEFSIVPHTAEAGRAALAGVEVDLTLPKAA